VKAGSVFRLASVGNTHGPSSGGTLNTWCSGYGVELKNVPIPKVTCSIPVQTECKTSGFSETAGESQSKDLHSLASALCGNSSNRWTKILANTYLLQPGNLDGDLSNRLL